MTTMATSLDITVGRCDSYERCLETLDAGLEESGLSAALSGRRVLLKPNLMKAAPANRCLNTHPSFVGSLTLLLVSRGCEVIVGDSSGLLGLTDEVLTVSGVRAAVERAGGVPVNLDAGPFVPVVLGQGRRAHQVWLPRLLFEVDAVISVPKLKTHQLTVISGAVKNLVGLLPGATKCALHGSAPSREAFAGRVLDLYQALTTAGAPPLWGIIDGIWGLAGQGRRHGPRRMESGLVLFGDHLIGLDCVAAELMGISPDAVPLLEQARQRGLLASGSRPRRVPLRGTAVDDAPVAYPPARPDVTQWCAPITAAYYWMRGRVASVAVDLQRCCGHGRCVEICPVRCVTWRHGRIHVGRECIRCYACVTQCPSGAMKLTIPAAFRPFFERRAEGIRPNASGGGG